jgi:formylglycine-generating enzyme required for sulfatase activity
MDTADFPVEKVSWFDCVMFCNRLSELERREPYYGIAIEQRQRGSVEAAAVRIAGGDGYRLLTDAEWEYVARAGTSTVFPWGDSLSSTQANFNGERPYGDAAKGPNLHRTALVGSYAPNPWGLYDLLGNVDEFVWDWWSDFDYQQFATTTAVDPRGPSAPSEIGAYRVSRGGCWSHIGQCCRPAHRGRVMPEGRNSTRGFRVARSLLNE